MASIDLIRASNGSGDAVKATVTNARVISSTTIQVDATTNWPSKFIATVGSVDGTGAFVPATVTVFNGTLSGGNIEITSFAPGYTDLGNTPGQIVVLKPTTAWANEMANTLAVAHNDNGTLKNDSVTTAAITDANVTTAKIADGAVTAGKIDFATLNPGKIDLGAVKIQWGWTFVTGTGAVGASRVVTFPEAFATTPLVYATMVGYKSGSDPTGPSDIDGNASWTVGANTETTTQFMAFYSQGSGTLPSNLRIVIRWWAIGS